jgi:thiamine-phosphate diphosphorylase
MGEPMKISQGDVHLKGHAIECRINAEDPFDDFRPCPGRIEMYYAPGGKGTRVDSHAYAGYTIPPTYDSMIGKLITVGKDRREAMDKMSRSLSEYMITGIKTSIAFEQAILQDPTFRRGGYRAIAGRPTPGIDGMKPLRDCRLYTFIDTAWLRGRPPAAVALQLCQGGADLIQLRAKDVAPAEILRLGRELLPIAREHGVRLVINDHPQVARELGADLCHLGQEDFFGRPSCQDELSGVPFGLSTHAPEQAVRALAANPAYIAIGPVHATPTKPGAKPVTLDYVRWAAQNITIPWFAIGGINLTNLDAVLATGATRICVVTAILNAPDVASACAEFKTRLA